MIKGRLDPRSNSDVIRMRFTGSFGQPDGFGSILDAAVKTSGNCSLTLVWKHETSPDEKMWSVELTNEQRKALGQMLMSYEPVLFEEIKK